MKNYICVYDFETDGKKPETCEPVQIASCMIHPHTLDIVPDSEFTSFMRPLGIDDEDYYESHKDTIAWHAGNYIDEFGDMEEGPREEAIKSIYQKWKDAPSQSQVWGDFCQYLLKYNNNQSRRAWWTAPIRGGHNIIKFDDVITKRLCARYNQLTKDGETKIFYPRDVIDAQHLCFFWFENLPEPTAYNMAVLREFFGMEEWGAHDALNDVKDSSVIIQKFMRLFRATAAKVKFKGAMSK